MWKKINPNVVTTTISRVGSRGIEMNRTVKFERREYLTIVWVLAKKTTFDLTTMCHVSLKGESVHVLLFVLYE
jgi:hypothetical protein